MFKSFLVLFFCVGLSVAQSLLGGPIIKKECGPNAEFKCVRPCPPEKSCRDRENYACLAILMSCGYECVCKEGFFRSFEGGDCITEEQCDELCPGANEHYTCGGPCDDVCSTLDSQNKTSCPYTDCEPSCYCDDGYARDESGNCIPVDKC